MLAELPVKSGLRSYGGLLCNTQGLNILLNMFFGPVINATRGIATQVESVLIQFVGNFQTAINPQITKNISSHNQQRSHYLLVKTSKFCFVLFLIVAIPLYLEIEYILGLWLTEIPFPHKPTILHPPFCNFSHANTNPQPFCLLQLCRNIITTRIYYA